MFIVLIIVIGVLNFFYLTPPVINWDEGTHAIWGFREWLALKDGNLLGFWQFSQSQFAYPPFGSWLITFLNFPFEFSMNLTRFVSTLGFIFGGILLYLLSKQLFSQKRVLPELVLPEVVLIRRLADKKLGQNSLRHPFFSLKYLNSLIPKFLILLLYLTSPAILFYSVTVFKEAWGATLTLLVFYLYFRALTQKTARAYFCVGLGLVLLFFEKYNYAMLLVLTFGLEAMVELVLILFIVIPNLFRYLRHIKILKRVQDDSKIVLKNIILRQAAIFLPLLIFASWWILTPTNKLGWFFDIMRSDWNPVTVGVGDKWQYLLYFVQSIKTSYTFSNVLFLVILIGFLASLTAFNVKKVRVLAVFFILNFTLGTLHWYNLQDRYIYTSIPVLFLLVGFGWSKVLAKIMGPASGLFLIFALLVLKDFTSLPSYLKANATHMLLSPMYNESDYHDTLFNYDFEKWPRGARSGSARQETTEQVIDYILDKIDINKPIEIVGYTAEISPDWVELRMALRRRDKSIKYKVLSSKYNKFLVTVEVKTTSRLYTYDYKRANAWQLEKVKEIEKNYSDKLIEEKDFKELGVKVKIYENYY